MVLLESVSLTYTISVSILKSQEDITPMMIINRLLEENRKLHKEGAGRSEIMMLTNYGGKLGTQNHKAGHRLGGDRHCKICKSTMHHDVDCWIKHLETQPMRKSYGGPTKGIHEDGKMAMSAYVSTTTTDHTWIINSKATNHLYSHRDLFDNYLTLSQPTRIQTAKGEMFAIGTGSITIAAIGKKSKINILELINVLHVPGMDANLLSVSTIIDKGFDVTILHSKGTTIQQGDKIIANGIRYRGL
jgi:Pol polyprotein, beta-barrel domain